MTEQPEVAAEREAPEKAPPKQRPKMTLTEQAAFLSDILRRCTMHSGDMKGQFAGVASITLATDDMLRLETIQQTMALFEMHGADKMVRDKIVRRFRK